MTEPTTPDKADEQAPAQPDPAAGDAAADGTVSAEASADSGDAQLLDGPADLAEADNGDEQADELDNQPQLLSPATPADMTQLAQDLIGLAQGLGHRADVVDFQPRAGGFVVPADVARAYAAKAAEPEAPEAPKGPKGARKARKSATPRKRAAAKPDGGAANG